MQDDYALPVNTSSKLINQVNKTSSEFFNHKMYALLDKVKMFEAEYRLSDPRSTSKDVKYSTLGPLGIIPTLQAAHGFSLAEHDWPALSHSLPQSNAAPVTTSSGRKCYGCGSTAHLLRNCPQKDSTGAVTESSRKTFQPMADWNYVQPADLTILILDTAGTNWYFCTKCTYRATQKVGRYQRTHTDATHISARPKVFTQPRGSAPVSIPPPAVAVPAPSVSNPLDIPSGNPHTIPPLIPMSLLMTRMSLYSIGCGALLIRISRLPLFQHLFLCLILIPSSLCPPSIPIRPWIL